MRSPLAWLLIQPIRFYQRFISRYTPPTCRYYPCCSNYAITALREHGAIIGTALTIWRLLRCNPWSSGGVDHVPIRGEHWWVLRRSQTVASHAEGAASTPASDDDTAPTAGTTPTIQAATTLNDGRDHCVIDREDHRLDAPIPDGRPAAAQPTTGRAAA